MMNIKFFWFKKLDMAILTGKVIALQDKFHVKLPCLKSFYTTRRRTISFKFISRLERNITQRANLFKIVVGMFVPHKKFHTLRRAIISICSHKYLSTSFTRSFNCLRKSLATPIIAELSVFALCPKPIFASWTNFYE
jgi:hypothetical protein